jgi:hypothetical protein
MTQPSIYALTCFERQRQTIPSVEYTDLSAATIIERVAPKDGPRILTEKHQAPHFVTSPLRVAPYVHKTAARFPPGAQGKQRSSSHVIESAWFPFDIDDISGDDKAAILGALEGFVYCAFSTHSNGKESGHVRMRVLAFADRTLEPADWTRAWHSIDRELFDGKADKTTAQMHQCAAVWATHPDREALSFRHVGKGDLLSADTLLAVAPKLTPRAPYISPPTNPSARRAKYEAALQWRNAGVYVVWNSTFMALVAAVVSGELNDADARTLWLTWSDTAPAARRARNDDARYSPDAMWERKPTLTTAPGRLIGALFGQARDEAVRCLKLEWPGKLSPRAVLAATYLRLYFPLTLEKLRYAA